MNSQPHQAVQRQESREISYTSGKVSLSSLVIVLRNSAEQYLFCIECKPAWEEARQDRRCEERMRRARGEEEEEAEEARGEAGEEMHRERRRGKRGSSGSTARSNP